MSTNNLPNEQKRGINPVCFEAETLKELISKETILIKDIFKMILKTNEPSSEDWLKCSIGIVENKPELKYLYFNGKKVAIIEMITKIENMNVEIDFSYRIL